MIKRILRSSMRTKLVVGLLTIVLVMAALSASLGIRLISRNIITDAYDSLRNSLAATSELYEEEITRRSSIIEYLAKTPEIVKATENQDRNTLYAKLVQIRDEFQFDIVNLVTPEGKILVRANSPYATGDSIAHYRYIQSVMKNRKPAAGTGFLDYSNMAMEGAGLAGRTAIRVRPTPYARQGGPDAETRAMVIKVATPIMSRDKMIGILFGAVLLNNNASFVDRFRRIVFKEEKINGKQVGATTLFLGDVRIATNVTDAEGKRAVGTRVSEEVYRRVYEGGETWIGDAFVVNSWYLSGYTPIYDIDHHVLGMLYVGILKEKFDQLYRENTVWFLLVVFLTTAVALGISVLLINVYTKPVHRIIGASMEIAQGSYNRIEVDPDDDRDAQSLARAFNRMVDAIELRDGQLKDLAEKTILKSEKLASVGRLASGIAHEINNPLTGVLTYSSLLLDDLKNTPYAEDLEVIRNETLRCRKIVRGVLDFARENKPEKVKADVNAIIDACLQILDKHVSFQNIKIVKDFDPALPEICLDINQFQSVINNLAVNAADAMPNGGQLTITTRLEPITGKVVIKVADSGTGISLENIGRIFEPFFTTKDKGKGTGLGLAMTYGIIQRHNGSIDVSSKIGEGTEFIIELPAQ